MPDSDLRVSVVVPVFNAGSYLDRCAPSLLQQSIGPEHYEVIYVDDGSTDGSPDRLAELAVAHPHVRHLTQPNSGWPGKPRNVGVDAARGAYVQFVDQDDELAPEALARLHAVAVANDSDVVLGKMGGSMSEPNLVFRRSVAAGTLADVPAIESLTGHKMFRRAFLAEHGIRFPEGYWRMEDLLFVARVYAAQPRISVVADYTCYLWHAREDGGNSSVAAFDIAGHYQRLRVIVDTLRDGLPPGPLADAVLGRLYRLETLSRVHERYLFDPRRTDWYEAFPHLRAVARECFPASVRAALPAVTRLRGALVEAGERDAVYELARRVAGLLPVIDRGRLEVDDEGVLHAPLRFSLSWPGDGPLALVTEDTGGWRLDPRLVDGLAGKDATEPPVTDPALTDLPLTDPGNAAHGQLQLQHLSTGEWWYPEGELRHELRPGPGAGAWVPGMTGELRVDPATAADGNPLPPGRYAVWFSGQLLGVNRRRRLVVPKKQRDETPSWTVSAAGPVTVRPDWSAGGARLQLEVADRQSWLAARVSEAEPDARSTEPELTVRVPGRLPPLPVPVALTLTDPVTSATRTLAGELGRGPEGAATARLRLPTQELPDGHWLVALQGSDTGIGSLSVARGRLQWVEGSSFAAPAGLGSRLRRVLRRPR